MIPKNPVSLMAYMRIQGKGIKCRERPFGMSFLNWNLLINRLDNLLDIECFEETYQWFSENLPSGVVTWFKTENREYIFEHVVPLIILLQHFDVPYDIIYTNKVGKKVYENDFQVGTIGV